MQGWIDRAQLADMAETYKKTGYGQYLKGLLGAARG